MNIGYACQTVGIPFTNLRTCTQKNATDENLTDIIAYNLDSLNNMLDYNLKMDIKLFRISSDLIPFGSSPVNTLKWYKIFEDKFIRMGKKAREQGMRLSMHPGQYTVINSPHEDVVERAFKDLVYHNQVLDSLLLGKSHKIVLHIGGVYGDKELAINRFIENFNRLEDKIKDRIVLENDDKLYNIEEVLNIASKVQVPVIYDNLHHKINPCVYSTANKAKVALSSGITDETFWIEEAKKTWKEEDGNQKIHYSLQNPAKKPGSHSDTIDGSEFYDFINKIQREDIDIMLEVKDKNLSAVKCKNVASANKSITFLEKEWSRYKYSVLERSPADYQLIRNLLKNKEDYPVLAFYECIDRAMGEEVSIGNGVNGAQHVWGYFKDKALEKEKELIRKKLDHYADGKLSLKALKKSLWDLTLKYQEEYLLNSYYFAEVFG